MHLRHVCPQLGGLRGQRLRADEHLGAAVADDVRGLAGGEPAADGGVDDAGALRRPADLEAARVVFQHQRDALAHTHADAAEDVRQPLGGFVELPVADGLAAACHAAGGLVR